MDCSKERELYKGDTISAPTGRGEDLLRLEGTIKVAVLDYFREDQCRDKEGGGLLVRLGHRDDTER